MNLRFILITTFYFTSMIVRSSIEDLKTWYLGCVQFHVSQYLRYWKCVLNLRFILKTTFYFAFMILRFKIEELRAKFLGCGQFHVSQYLKCNNLKIHSDDYFLFCFYNSDVLNRRIEGLIPRLCPISCFPVNEV